MELASCEQTFPISYPSLEILQDFPPSVTNCDRMGKEMPAAGGDPITSYRNTEFYTNTCNYFIIRYIKSHLDMLLQDSGYCLVQAPKPPAASNVNRHIKLDYPTNKAQTHTNEGE